MYMGLKDVVIYATQSATHIGAVYLRSIREHRDLSLRTVLIAKGDGIGDDILKVGVQRRLTIAGKGDDIGSPRIHLTLDVQIELVLNHSYHIQ